MHPLHSRAWQASLDDLSALSINAGIDELTTPDLNYYKHL